MALQVMGGKQIANLSVGTLRTAADDPSRDKELRLASVGPSWAHELLDEKRVDFYPGTEVPWDKRSGVELRAGCARLTAALRVEGLVMDASGEASGDKRYAYQWFDLNKDTVNETLLRRIRAREIRYLHVGFPCSTWGNAGRMNDGTQRKHCPHGSGSLPREDICNKQWRDAARVIVVSVEAGG